MAYVEDNGPLDYQRRFDEPAALVAWTVANANRLSGKPFDEFLRYQPKNDLNDIDNGFLKLFGIKM